MNTEQRHQHKDALVGRRRVRLGKTRKTGREASAASLPRRPLGTAQLAARGEKRTMGPTKVYNNIWNRVMKLHAVEKDIFQVKFHILETGRWNLPLRLA